MRFEDPGRTTPDQGRVKPTSLQRLHSARERLARLMDELSEFQRELEDVADSLFEEDGQKEKPAPQSVKRADAPVVEAPRSGAENEQ